MVANKRFRALTIVRLNKIIIIIIFTFDIGKYFIQIKLCTLKYLHNLNIQNNYITFIVIFTYVFISHNSER